MRTFITRSEAETEALAQRLSSRLLPGDVLLLRGGLAAGKTAFVRGLARGLGCDAPVSSPTFALVHEYGGEPPLVHCDLYRLDGARDVEDIGLMDHLGDGAVLAIEWPDVALSLLPKERIQVTIGIAGEEERSIEISGLGERGVDM